MKNVYAISESNQAEVQNFYALACRMADAFETQRKGEYDKASRMIDKIYDECQQTNDEKLIALCDGIIAAIQWHKYWTWW